MPQKSYIWLLIAPISFVSLSLLMTMSGGNPFFPALLFAPIEFIAGISYTICARPTSFGLCLECAASNKWIKLANLVSDLTMLAYFLYFRLGSSCIQIIAFLPILPYIVSRVLVQFCSLIVAAKIADGAAYTKGITFKCFHLHVLLHLIPVLDVCSACWIDRQLNKMPAK